MNFQEKKSKNKVPNDERKKNCIKNEIIFVFLSAFIFSFQKFQHFSKTNLKNSAAEYL